MYLSEISSRIIQLQNKSKEQDKKLKAFQQKGQAGLADKLIESAKVLGDIKIIKAVVPETSPNDLRSLAAQINKRTVPSVVLLVSEHNRKCGLVCICSDKLVKAGHQAGKYLGKSQLHWEVKVVENLILPWEGLLLEKSRRSDLRYLIIH